MKNVLHQIESKYQNFTKSEKKIADFILKCPHLIIKMSVQDLAKEINTSTASIVRFSKKITDQGFQELKIYVSRYLPSDTTKKQLHGNY
jgi:DNA-binding MurR/RpiR family transcriptional regulator